MVIRPRLESRPGVAFLGLVMIALSACTFPETQIAPGEKHLVVHAVLDLGTRNQEILVTYSDTGNVDHDPIVGVVISIATPDGVQMFAVPDSLTSFNGTRFPTSSYHVPLDAYGVTLVPGATYTLHVHTAAGDDATGTTTIPQASPVSVPTATELFTRKRDTLRLTWPAVVGAASYEVRVVGVDTAIAGYQAPLPTQRYAAFAAQSATLSGMMNSLDYDDVFSPFSHTTVIVSAVDANYYDYYRQLSDPFTASAPSHLTGAVGVFGSVVPIVARYLSVH